MKSEETYPNVCVREARLRESFGKTEVAELHVITRVEEYYATNMSATSWLWVWQICSLIHPCQMIEKGGRLKAKRGRTVVRL